MQRKTKRRLVASVTVLLAAGVIRAVTTPAKTLASAELAGDQLRNADAVAAVTAVKLDLLGSLDGLISLAVLVALALIWLPLLRRLPAAAVLVAAGASLASTRPALAYYDTVNRAEAVTIMPNESAFWIPDTGGQ